MPNDLNLWDESESADSPSTASVSPTSELANAGRIANRHYQELRFVLGEGWHRFAGTHWRPDELGAQELASRVSRYVMEEADAKAKGARQAPDEQAARLVREQEERLRKWAHNSERNAVIKNSLELAESRLKLAADRLDTNPYLLNTLNGTLDLNKGELHPHDPFDYLTRCAPVAFDPDATAPTWEKFLKDILPDEELRRYVQKAVAYTLSGIVREQVLFMLIGDGANGKSTFMTVLMHLLGSGYAKRAAPNLLISSPLERHATEIADLKGSRLIYVSEVDTGRRFASDRLKQFTGETSLKARHLYKDFFEFDLTAKFWLALNHKPEVQDTSDGFWRRVRLIPFNAKFEGEGNDPRMLDKLLAELPGILNWALEGYRLYLAEGLKETPMMVDQRRVYRYETDSVRQYIDQACEVGDPLRLKTPAGELYPHYQAWCRMALQKPVSNAEFKRQVEAHGYPQKKNDGSKFYKGIRPLPIAELVEAA